MTAKRERKNPRIRALLKEGTLNPSPEKIKDPKFLEGEFFDPHDIVQVKYEMLRRVSADNLPVTDATEQYGVSRPTYYQAKASFEGVGISGLVPRKRGPQGPHKVQGEMLQFIQERVVAGKPIRARQLAKQIFEKFGAEIHPRTIERVVKKTLQ